MDTSGIEALLEKFYGGDTSLQEEKVLRAYFGGDNIPDHLKLHQPMFTYFRNEQSGELKDPHFERKLTARLTNEVDSARVVRMHPARGRIMFFTSLAASVLLIIGLFFIFQVDQFDATAKLQGSPEAEIAYADASAALLLVSGNLNNGIKELEKIDIVEKAMTELEHFNKFYHYQTIIINPDLIKK